MSAIPCPNECGRFTTGPILRDLGECLKCSRATAERRHQHWCATFERLVGMTFAEAARLGSDFLTDEQLAQVRIEADATFGQVAR